MELCVFCQGELAAGSRLCPRCGRTQPEQPIAVNIYQAATLRRQDKYCPDCGTGLPARARFCSNCGRSIMFPAEQGNTRPGSGFVTVASQAEVQTRAAGQISAPVGGGGTLPPLPMPASSSAARRAQPWSWFGASKTLLLVVLVVVIIGAASTGLYLSTRHASSTASHLPEKKSTTTPVPPTATPIPPPMVQFNSPASADMDGLHIQTDGIFCDRYLVLAQPQYTYDAATIMNIQNYVNVAQYVEPTDAQLPANMPPLPDALTWVPGADQVCTGGLDLTNTGSASIQINTIGVQFLTNAIENTYTYRLIDVCSVLQQPGCGPGRGGYVPCDYEADIALVGGAAGNQQQTPVKSSYDDPQNCPVPLTIGPSQTVNITVNISSAPAHLLYKVQLTVGINDASGATTLTLPSTFDSTLVYIEPDSPNITCYGLNGNTFVLLSPQDLQDPGRRCI